MLQKLKQKINCHYSKHIPKLAEFFAYRYNLNTNEYEFNYKNYCLYCNIELASHWYSQNEVIDIRAKTLINGD